jgi:methionyl-tRNA formyltransferase
MINYVVASSKDWYIEYPKSKEYDDLNIFEIKTKADLNLELLEKINPRYIFFPHWNWKVDSEIFERYECVVFHTAPLPFV